MNQALEEKLIACLDAWEQGETIDEILARYPEDAKALRPMLETAVSLNQLPLQPSLDAQAKSRRAFLDQAAAMRQAAAQPSPWRRLRRALSPVLAIFLALLLLGAALVPVSADAIPGDLLYAPKRWLEDFRLSLVSGAEQEALLTAFEQERIEEIEALLAAKRMARVRFQGIITDLGTDAWIIAGLTTQITPQTHIDGQPAVDRLALVEGSTENGRLFADDITVITIGDSDPSPLPDPTATPTPSPTMTPESTLTETPTATSTQTATATATETAVPTDTLTPTFTATPDPSPTATLQPSATPTSPPSPPSPTPNDEDDDNSNGSDDNDNDNDNGDDNDNENNNEGDDGNENDNDNEQNDNGGEENDNEDDNDNDDDDDDNENGSDDDN